MQRLPALIMLFALPITSAMGAGDLPLATPTPERCIAQLRAAQAEWIECDAQFETDAATQAELSRQTFDMLQKARCGGRIRVQRAALVSALMRNGVLELDPQDILCNVQTSYAGESQLALTVAPRVSFEAGRIADISPRLQRVAQLPDLLVAPLRAAAESQFVRGQLTRALNLYLEQALGK